MSSDDPSHKRNRSTPQAIPLQDLGQQSDDDTLRSEQSRSHRRTLSERGRDLFQRSRKSLLRRDQHGTAYGPVISEHSTPSSSSSTPARHVGLGIHDTAYNPVAPSFSDPSKTPGISLTEPAGYSFTSTPSKRPNFSALPLLQIPSPSSSMYEDFSDSTNAFASENDMDNVPLTQPGHSRSGRNFHASPQLLTPHNDPSRDVEQGNLTPTPRSKGKMRSNSILTSPIEGPLRKAGAAMKNLSQRVVNLTNEPEVAEKNIKRSPSTENLSPTASHNDESGMTFDHGEAKFTGSPTREKNTHEVSISSFPELPERRGDNKPSNPLRGKSLGIFGPQNRFRLWLLDVLTHPVVEPFILLLIVLQAVAQIITNATNVFVQPQGFFWTGDWIDLFIFILYCLYSIEIVAKIIVSGFIGNAREYSTIDRDVGFLKAVKNKASDMFAIQAIQRGQVTGPTHQTDQPTPLLRLSTKSSSDNGASTTREAARRRLAHRAFLRHSFNRLDFVAVVSFWLGIAISWTGNSYYLVFNMMSCLRVLRLLGITNGTLVILRSLKRAAPILLNVAFLIGFFWLMFAIVGVQSFKSSLRRYCCWSDFNNTTDPPWPQYNQSLPGQYQFCGGYLGFDGKEYPYITADGFLQNDLPKGYICPMGSQCIESTNPYNNTVSFDNVLQSMELVFVIMTSNTFTDIMYYLTDADYLFAAFFFAAGILFLTLWLLNLLIAVITSSFHIIRQESRTSAFAADHDDALARKEAAEALQARPKSTLQRWFHKTRWLWILIIVADLIAHGYKSATRSSARSYFISVIEVFTTISLDVEILIRLAIGWRHFFKSKRNIADLFLAIITSTILIPAIHYSGRVYTWLTIFQVLRIYRVVLFVTFVRDLIAVVLGNTSGLANLIFFVFLLTFLSAIFASELFRGVLPSLDNSGNPIQTPFFSYWNSFLGMYQILSSENWTTMLYNVTAYQAAIHAGWIGATFLILWYILSNFIVLNMFIAVIQENFDVSEDEKRLRQVKAFIQQKRSVVPPSDVLSLQTIFRLGRPRKLDPTGFGSAARELLLKDAVVKEFLDEGGAQDDSPSRRLSTPTHSREKREPTWPEKLWKRIYEKIMSKEPNPFHSRSQFTHAQEDMNPRTMAQEVYKADERRKVAQREYLKKYPNYDRALMTMRQGNPLRKLCQSLVGLGSGDDRIERPNPSPTLSIAFSTFIYAAIVAMVLLACITTPLYQKEYFARHGYSRGNWFVWTDAGFAIIFTIEIIIKVIADGLYWTPNAFFRSAWGRIDGIVLVTLWATVISLFSNPGSGSRAVGAFKALRALRLLNFSHSARNTFHSVLITGIWKIIAAAIVSLSLLIPFALFGLNLFNGRMQVCNDNYSGIFNLTDCVGEWMSSPYQWNVLAPRQVNNNYYSFDDFGQALFILFQIVSQEGWIDVMWSAQGITGVFTQPRYFAGEGNSIFFVVFNLLGSVFVLTLFVSIFMRNYTEQTGVAFLTVEQRSWLELRKLLRQVSPSKRPSSLHQRRPWQEWCYKAATNRKGWWHKLITYSLLTQLVLLCLEWYPDDTWWPSIRLCLFLLLTLIFLLNVMIRIIGLTWRRFVRSAWDIYSVIVITILVITTCIYWAEVSQRDIDVIYKIPLTAITLQLIPRNDQLDHLFKTAAASLGAIGNLLATWFVLFLVFAIALTQVFGLTRFGPNEKPNLNFRTTPKALIFLFRTSMGEGWNQLMHDFATIKPPYCTEGTTYFDGDCGSENWAQALFVLWNIISMYIFVNLFVSLIFESFSYVYQRNNGLSVISREEIRRFKQAWAEHDPTGSGYISKEAFPRLLAELNGVFEVRIYDGDYTVRRILELCSHPLSYGSAGSSMSDFRSGRYGEVSLKRLNAHLSQMPVDEIRLRRRRMNSFYEEVLVSADAERGIEFTTLLLIIAHYKIIVDSRSLRLEEFLQRRVRLQRIDEAVQRNIVVGFFDTLYWSRKFRSRLAARKAARLSSVHDFAVPEIVVQDEASSPRGVDEKSAKTPVVHVTDDESDASPTRGRPSPALRGTGSDTNSTASPQVSPTREGSRWHLSAALTQAAEDSPSESRGRSPETSSLDPNRSLSPSRERSPSVSHQDMMTVLDNSAWGASIHRTMSKEEHERVLRASRSQGSLRPSLGSRNSSGYNTGDEARESLGSYRRLP